MPTPASRGKPSWEAASCQEQLGSRRPGQQTQSTDPGQESSQGVRQSCAEDPEPSPSWGHYARLPAFPPHQQQQHPTETEKPRTSPPCGLPNLVLGGKGAQGKGKSQRVLVWDVAVAACSSHHPSPLLPLSAFTPCSMGWSLCWLRSGIAGLGWVRGTNTWQIITM